MTSEKAWGTFTRMLQSNPIGIFDRFYSPFLHDFEQKLTINLDRIAESSPIKIVSDDILLKSLVSLKQDLIGICIKSLITELYTEKQMGTLLGEDSSQRYSYFNDLLATSEYRSRILDKYPVLVDLIHGKINSKLELILEVMRRMTADRELIRNQIGIDVTSVETMKLSVGDSHNGGKSVVILGVNKGAENLVYKPHTMSPEASFNRLLSWVNDKKELRCPVHNLKVIDQGTYGWQEFVAYQSCERIEEVSTYYYRVGVLLSLFKIIKCGDIHHENIIACRDFPIIVDLETLLTQEDPQVKTEDILSAFMKEIGDSVLGTLILPQNFEHLIFDFDISGLSGEGGVRSNKIVDYELVHRGTDEIRILPKYYETVETHNRVKLGERKVSVAEFRLPIEQGFYDGYSLVLKHRNELIDLIQSGEMFTGHYRQVLRPTHVYGRFLDASLHPKYLTDHDKRTTLFSFLYNNNQKMNEKTRRKVACEINAMMRNDVPYFCVDMHNTRLYAESGTIVDSYYEQSLVDGLLNRIRRLNEADLKKQLRYISNSLSTTREASPAQAQESMSVRTNGGLRIQGTTVLSGVIEIADYLIDTAVWSRDKSACTWLTLLTVGDDKLRLGPLHHSLHEGGGVILFLAYVAKETGISKYEQAARACLEGLEIMWKSEGQGTLSAFTGLCSSVYLYYNLSVMWNSKELYEKHLEQLRRMCSLEINSDHPLDYVGGLSGAIIACLNIYESGGVKEALVTAEKMGKHLFTALLGQLDGHLTGLAHGYAGYALAMSKLGDALGKNEYVKLGAKLIETENRYFDEQKQNWKDLRTDTAKENDLVFWCHGAAGIGLSRMQLMNSSLEPIARQAEHDLKRAVKKLVVDGFSEKMDHSLCHGVVGNLDILLSIGQVIGDDSLIQCAYSYVLSILQTMRDNGIQSGLEHTTDLVGFMLGLSGIGYGLLRFTNPEIPSVLGLEVSKRKVDFS